MRRLLLTALAVAIAAPIPVALAQTVPEVADEAAAELAERHLAKVDLRQEARTAMRSVERRAAAKKRAAARKRAAAKRRAAAKEEAAAARAIPPHLAAIAQCESGGNPAAIGGGGLYRGMFQFDQSTWASVGGTGDPAAAPVAEQVKRAEILYSRAGSSPWPVCG